VTAQDAESSLLCCDCLNNSPHYAAQVPLKTCRLSANLVFFTLALKLNKLTFTLVFEHHLLFLESQFYKVKDKETSD
jgi:hypothetical protein